MVRSVWPIFFLVSLLFCPSGFAQLWSGILAPNRATDWTNAGVPGGIPSASWTQCGATIAPYGSSGSAASPSTINTAIAGCGANHYVQLGAGTFYLNAGITWGTNGTSNVAIRGMGADQTFIVFTNGDGCLGNWADVCMSSADTNWSGGPSNTANWTAGYTQGTTSITLSGYSNLKVGAPLILDQADDAADNGNFFVCSSNTISPPCSLEDNLNNGQRAHRNETQIVQVAACGTATTFGQACNGSNITISPGLYADNWTSSKSPGAWWATTPVYYDGLENLSIDHTSSSGNKGVEIFNCYGCWVSGVRSVDSGKAHVEIQESAHVTVQNSYLYLTQNSVSQSYGIEPLNAADVLAVNNIMQYVAGPWTINGACPGCAFAYNFAINDYYTNSSGYVSAATNQHTGGIYDLLYEGNIGPQSYADNFHGTHDTVTLYRNYLSGTEPVCWKSGSYPSASLATCTGNQTPILIFAYSRYYNVVGNVLGQSGVQSGYTSGEQPIYQLNTGNTEDSVTVPPDPLVTTTLLRWGNYDTITAAVRWCGSASDTGWTTTCGGASEVPSGLSAYANPIPTKGDTSAGQSVMPPSFVYSSKPSWWTNSVPWPAIGPDVTGGNVSGVAGHANENPAEVCYLNVMGGPADGSGSALSFNAGTCYGTGGTAKPNPPTGLTGVVQ
ncbi:MAG TPA: hypothetical protein VHX37_09625 [Acidobacteriaceae bacterium]|jgi:hypothetical protein|nr:hypothetical protein [Acidobacteriaceae bacterium]